MSQKNINIMDLFNKKHQREFFTNSDYEKVGGIPDDLDSQFKVSEKKSKLSSMSECVEDFQKVQSSYQ